MNLYKFEWDCGRQGTVSGVFIATEEEIKNAIGKYVYLGEALGKHSEVYGNLEEEDLEKKEISNECIEELYKIFGNTINGYNPLCYIQYTDEEGE